MTTRLHEPVRLFSDTAIDPTMVRLLRSATVDNPSARALRDAPAGILAKISREVMTAGVPTGEDEPRLGVARDSRARVIRVAKWVGVTALFGTSVAAAVIGVTQTTVRDSSVPIRSTIAPAASAVAAKVYHDAPRIPALERDVRVPSAARPGRGLTPKLPPRGDLVREVSYLDAAKAALSVSNPAAALQELDQADRLSRRALGPEATVLRVRALIASGRRSEARRVVERYIQVAPNSPQAAVLNDLMASSENE